MNDKDATQKIQVFSSFRRPEEPFRHQEGHRRAGAVSSSSIIPENTPSALNGEEHRRTVNILNKFGKRTIGLSDVSIVSSSTLAVKDTVEDNLT